MGKTKIGVLPEVVEDQNFADHDPMDAWREVKTDHKSFLSGAAAQRRRPRLATASDQVLAGVATSATPGICQRRDAFCSANGPPSAERVRIRALPKRSALGAGREVIAVSIDAPG